MRLNNGTILPLIDFILDMRYSKRYFKSLADYGTPCRLFSTKSINKMRTKINVDSPEASSLRHITKTSNSLRDMPAAN